MTTRIERLVAAQSAGGVASGLALGTGRARAEDTPGRSCQIARQGIAREARARTRLTRGRLRDPIVGRAEGSNGEIDNPVHLWLDMAMKHVKIAELKNRLSEHLRAVENGAEVVVMDRNRPIARIVPMPQSGRRIRLLQPNHDFADIRDQRRVRAGWRVPSTVLLLEERRER